MEITRRNILSEAIDRCLKELYEYAYPKVTWDDFIQENIEYREREKEYDSMPKENRPDFRDFVGPIPAQFYYLPDDIFKDILSCYRSAYRIPPEIKDNIETLIHYMNDPIRDKYIPEKIEENGFKHPGYKSYEHFTPLKDIIGEDAFEKVKEYMNEAANFYRWDGDLQMFDCSVYLGASPSFSKKDVIQNWKKYRNKDIEIDDTKIKREYYGEDDSDD